MGRVPRLALILACALQAAVAVASAPVSSQGQVFRTAVDTVPIYATVTDSRGALVTDLEARDFQVEDDGRRQTLTLFKSDLQPMTIAVLLDISPSVFGVSDRLRRVVTELVGRLLPADRACLGTFSHIVSLESTLTSDHATLVGHLADDVPFPAGTALWDALDAGRAALAAQGGRRVVLVVTDAADNSSIEEPSAVRTRLEREGVMVYAVGVSGKEGLQAREMTAIARATGGWYFTLAPEDDLPAAVQRIADQLHRQYVLGFSPRVLDDKAHRIEVKVTRAGLTVRARRFYVASSHADIR